MSQEISTLPDGTVRMCLTEDGITACTYVSSHHLVEDKWGYLKAVSYTHLTLPTKA